MKNSYIKDGELQYLAKISNKINNAKNYLNSYSLDRNSSDFKYWYDFLNNLKKIFGNFNNDISFISSMMVKEFLFLNHNIKPYNIELGSQNAPGIDIDTETSEGERIIAEIKSTTPYKKNDLGAQQKKTFFKDFAKLKECEADYKYFFLTEIKTFEIVKNKYKDNLEGVAIVLLPDAIEDRGAFTYF